MEKQMAEKVTFTQAVAKIQKELKAPKSQRNNFGNYNYRNQEDILEAVKPLLGDLVLTVSDEIVEVGGRIYVKATATISDGAGSKLVNTAFAREPEDQKGMSSAQITGSTSSYARKYALNGLFLIDDTKDPDTNEFQDNANKGTTPAKTTFKGAGPAQTAPAKQTEGAVAGKSTTTTSRFAKKTEATTPDKEDPADNLDAALAKDVPTKVTPPASGAKRGWGAKKAVEVKAEEAY